MATPRQVKQLAGRALVVGLATMVLGRSVAASSVWAGAVTFCVGLALVTVGVLKFKQAAFGGHS